MSEFAERYTAAWCSQDPASVAEFFSRDGSLAVNGGEPAVGREAITEVVRGYMTGFPDHVLLFDKLEERDGQESAALPLICSARTLKRSWQAWASSRIDR